MKVGITGVGAVRSPCAIALMHLYVTGNRPSPKSMEPASSLEGCGADSQASR